MSADSLYHAFGLKGYCVSSVRHDNQEIIVEARPGLFPGGTHQIIACSRMWFR